MEKYIKYISQENPHLTPRQIRSYIKQRHGNVAYHYALMCDKLETIPKWLREEGVMLGVSPQVLIKFNNELGDKKDWAKVKRIALHDAKNKYKITVKHVDDVKNNSVKSELLRVNNIDVAMLDDDEIKELCEKSLDNIKLKIPKFNIDNYDCTNWKKFLTLLDQLLYIIENVD